MAIISFWSNSTRETGQTLSAIATATRMAIEHNYKILLIDCNFSDDTIEKCFWKVDKTSKKIMQLNRGKMDISSGAEGLVSAVASNKTTPEIVSNYTRAVFKTLDILCGLKTTSFDNYSKSLMLYKDLVEIAAKYYDIVFLDLPKGMKMETTKSLLKISNIIIYNFTQNMEQIEQFLKLTAEDKKIITDQKLITLLSNADPDSKYNFKNVSRFIKDKNMVEIPYNRIYADNACEAGVANYFIKNSFVKTGLNAEFMEAANKVIARIEYKIEELKYL